MINIKKSRKKEKIRKECGKRETKERNEWGEIRKRKV